MLFGKKKQAPDTPEKSVRVLAVDDEEVIGYIIKRVGRTMGYEVDWVTNCRDALQSLDSKVYDVILSDFKMPEMNGDAFYREIAARSEKLLERLIFISGDTMNKDTLKFLTTVDVPFLAKPFDIEELKSLMQRTAAGRSNLP